MLLTELGWERIPKDFDEQRLFGSKRGDPREEHPHRLRYQEVSSFLQQAVNSIHMMCMQLREAAAAAAAVLAGRQDTQADTESAYVSMVLLLCSSAALLGISWRPSAKILSWHALQEPGQEST